MTEEMLYRDEDLTLGQLSEELELSVHQLSQYLNEQLNKNFATYINEYRVDEAKRLLVETPDQSVLSIGYQGGFNSKSGFNRAFMKTTGKSPSAYRAENLS